MDGLAAGAGSGLIIVDCGTTSYLPTLDFARRLQGQKIVFCDAPVSGMEAFLDEFDSINCRDIQTKQFGRPYYLRDENEFQKFEEAGAHEHKCPDVEGKATQMVVEIILDEDLLSL